MKSTFFGVVTIFSALSYASPVEKREGISSCGSNWMAIDDVRTNNGQIPRVGYNTAVDAFCNKAAGQSVSGQKYLSMATRIWLSAGGNPSTTGLNGWVYFEVHNKRDSAHSINAASCKQYLKALSATSSSCYGKDNIDTKGGTWQLGDKDVSYHALGDKIPPTSASVDKIVIIDGAIAPLGNGGNGQTLDPFPSYVFDDVVPVKCHSHNDYERDTALYSALSTGCIGVEADVWPHGDKLTVGHLDPGSSGPTIQDLYLNPIKKIIDERKAIFPKQPSQGLYLLVDFKGNGDTTWDLLAKALEPLRSAGYLSHYDNGFRQGLVTIIASGNALVNEGSASPSPLAKANDATANPGRAIFMDARVNKDLSNFSASNTFYASAAFTDAVQSGSGTVSGSNLDKMRAQIKAAHDKGFAVRYWDIPSQGQWQQFVDEGVDRLNADDLQNVAGVNWRL